jgi:diaminohydroxyphosphoribosylaminopyrimidine deaminase / 5-amino-6-(5-phosphoribosylamino)uracil reductase
VSEAAHRKFMQEALAEAKKGVGRTHPNPSVGAVVVKGSRIIGRGFTSPAGGPHAEVVALAQAKSQAKGATLYCTLEPCSHFGRTPPCVESIVRAGIKRVFFASKDPNPQVNGKGARVLRRSGIDVVSGLLSDEAESLNRPFFKWIRTGLPWVTLKTGMTLDGKLATSEGKSQWITSESARLEVHRLRAQVDAIVVGVQTVLFDNPRLTVRLDPPLKSRANPVRVVIDPSARLSARSRLLREPGRTIQVTREGIAASSPQVEHWTMPGKSKKFDIVSLLEKLGQEKLLHVLLEGGAATNAHFLESGQVDELMLFVAPKLLGHSAKTFSGEFAGSLSAQPFDFHHLALFEPDVLLHLLRRPQGRKSASE